MPANPNKPQPCLKCGGKTEVKDCRPTASGDITRRRRCLDCGYRFTTIEIVYDGHERSKEVAQWASEHNRGMIDDG